MSLLGVSLDTFSARFSEDDFIPELVTKYNEYLAQSRGPFLSIVDLLNATLLRASLFGVTIKTANQRTGMPSYDAVVIVPERFNSSVSNREITLTYSLLDGSINYLFLLDHMLQWYGKAMLMSDVAISTFVIQLLNRKNRPVADIALTNSFITSLSELSPDNSSVTIADNTTFEIVLSWNDLDIKLRTPKLAVHR